MTDNEMHSRIAEVVDSLCDIERAGEVVLCLTKALEIVIMVAANSKTDALNTAADVAKDMQRNIKKDYDRTCLAWEQKFPEAYIQ